MILIALCHNTIRPHAPLEVKDLGGASLSA